jgi:dihydroorotase-like cyclic amidohydrolase
MPPAGRSFGDFALLIRGARVFGPDELGVRDVLVAGGRIVAVEPEIARPGEWAGLRDVDARGLLLLPGLVDGHIHALGGGGLGGTRLSHHPPLVLYQAFREAVARGVPTGWALATVTRNPAVLFSLDAKGRVAVGADADLLLVDEGLELRQVYARGRLMLDAGRPVVRGTFEGRHE